MWELKHGLEELARPGRCSEEGVAYGPCLLLSRECGSGGSEIARRVARRLRWHIFDREILEEIAKLAHAEARCDRSSEDEKTPEGWRDGGEGELKPEDIGYEIYLRHLRQVVRTLAHQGNVVILGRGAQYLLPTACSLHVRVLAPMETRVRRVAQTTGLTPEEARCNIERFDADRAVFIQKSFQRDIYSALNYDLVINTGELSLEAAEEMVVVALGHKLGIRPQNGETQRRVVLSHF